jgi:hypothetical protein
MGVKRQRASRDNLPSLQGGDRGRVVAMGLKPPSVSRFLCHGFLKKPCGKDVGE